MAANPDSLRVRPTYGLANSTSPAQRRPLIGERSEHHKQATLPGGSLEELMTRYVQGDHRSFGQLYDLASPRLTALLMRMTQDRERAADAAQVTFLKLHKKKHQYRAGAPVLPWLYVIAKRTLIDEQRNLRAQRELLSIDGEVTATQSAPDLSRLETRAQVRRAVAQLPPQYRDAIELTKLDGLSGREAAHSLNTTAAAIKQRVHRGYILLRQLLQTELFESMAQPA